MGCTASAPGVVPTAGLGDSEASDTIPDVDFHAEYLLLEKLGTGAYGVVYAAERVGQVSMAVAVKVTDVRKASGKGSNGCSRHAKVNLRQVKKMRSEVEKQRHLRGLDNVCQVYDGYVQGGLAYIVLEKCERSLREALEAIPALSEKTLRPYLRGMLQGLAQVHGRGVVHRDVKPDNFMVTGVEDTVKLCDFGLSTSLSACSPVGCTGTYGTPCFMAPEMLKDVPYGIKVDTWSFGVCVYVLCFGRFPYSPAKMTGASVKAAIIRGVPAPSFRPKDRQDSNGSLCVSEGMAIWLRELLSRRPEARPTSAQALDFGFHRLPAPSTTSLRPVLHKAIQCGAFDADCQPPRDTELDHLLRDMQEQYHPRAPAEAKAPQPISEQSTELGSNIGGSGTLTGVCPVSF